MALFDLRNSKYRPSFHATKANFLPGTYFPLNWQLVSVVYAHLTVDQNGFVREVSHVEMTSGPHVVSLT